MKTSKAAMHEDHPHNSRRTFIAGSLALAGGTAFAPSAWAKRKQKKPDPPLFEDHFERKDRSGWGRQWFNQRYGRRWVLRGGRALYRLPPTSSNVKYRPNPVLVLDHDVSNVDLRATLSVSNETARVGLVARVAGYGDYYAAYLGPKGNIRIAHCRAHGEKTLARRGFRYEAGKRYRVRFQVRGSGPVALKAKVWPAGSPEPRAWTVHHDDATEGAILGRGPFGVYTHHAKDGRGAMFRIDDVVARSGQKRSLSPATVTYALAGVPHDSGRKIDVVAKASLPARVGFEYGPEPTLTQGVQQAGPFPARSRALTARATLDLGSTAQTSTIYWRPFTLRRGVKTLGPVGSFKLPPPRGLPVRFAFGACTQWSPWPHRSFEQARLKLPDLYLHQGDLGYVAHRVIDHAPDTYQDYWTRLLSDPDLASLCRAVPFSFYRDDADYGRNQADADSLRRFTIRAHGEMHANPSNDYFEFAYGSVSFFCLDCRRYSTGKAVAETARSKLGDEQTAWLKQRMTTARDDGASLLVVASPNAFGSDATPASWRKVYQREWSELIDFFQSLGSPVLIVSGDSHGHRVFEFPQKALPDGTPRIVEFLSAGTEQKKFFKEKDEQFLLPGADAKGSAFGLVELGPEQTVGGQRTQTLTLTAVRSLNGNTVWQKSYLIVQGLGILPLVV